MDRDISVMITEGLKFLSERQQRDGKFLSLSTSNASDFNEARKYNSTFPTSLILLALSDIKKDESLNKIITKGIDFLVGQKNEHWSFNYWDRNAKENKTLPYPDDLDDTFCALSAILKHKPEAIDGEALAKIVNILTFTEKEEGGPYKTWIVPPDAKEVWKDIDLAVNSNVAYFLSLQEVSLPNIDKLIEKKTDEENYKSPYYHSVYSVIYFISRFYKKKKKDKIVDYLIKNRVENNWGNPLDTALAVSALLNLGVKPKEVRESIDYIINNNNSKNWDAYSLCVELITTNATYYTGSPALTTAFCLEALNKYQIALDKDKKTQTKDSNTEAIQKAIVKKAKEKFSELDKELNAQATDILTKTLRADKKFQITLTPYFFASSLGKKGKEISNEFLIQLGLANLYGWIAYTIYDDFLDEEGDPKKLSVANVCLRELSHIFSNILPKDNGFFVFFRKTMDEIDSTNTWEVLNCRGIDLQNIPDYENYEKLAKRSMGHALGPIATLFFLGYNTSSKEMINTFKFFEHYIIAKQLNDDAHDWEEDIKKEHISPAIAMLLKKWKKKELDINKDFEELRNIFWNKVVVKICTDALNNLRIARKALKKISIIKDDRVFEKMLVSLEKSSDTAIEEQKKTLQFLRSYKYK